jgi:hypothetical protein
MKVEMEKGERDRKIRGGPGNVLLRAGAGDFVERRQRQVGWPGFSYPPPSFDLLCE